MTETPVRLMFFAGGRTKLSGKTFSGTVKVGKTTWSVVLETKEEPKFGFWVYASLRPMSEMFPAVRFASENCMLYEGALAVAYVSPPNTDIDDE